MKSMRKNKKTYNIVDGILSVFFGIMFGTIIIVCDHFSNKDLEPYDWDVYTDYIG